ncbi:MAG: MmcQ/YjbR family DNA-binding protein [Myxococcota bacterium]|nr:MmcQ/YjbR family DNA-binding protein [Myxococcota bacterium]
MTKWRFKGLRSSLLEKKQSVEEYPFGPDAAVYKVMGKMFALVAWQDDPLRINLKCDPDEAHALRSMFQAVQPGYHMNKEHWNTVLLDGSIEKTVVLEMIDASYNLVVKGLKKADRMKLAAMSS